MSLTARQKQYIWLMGSYPDKVAMQGRGYRSPELKYGIDGHELVIFGYSTPLLWLRNRGLVRRLQDMRYHELTEEGRAVFQRLLLDGFGASAPVREVKVAPRNAVGENS